MSKRFLVTVFMLLPMVSSAQDAAYCGDEGVWLQILGSGGSDITDQRSAASYVVWHGEHARLMVDTGSGSALRFDEAGADFADLDAIVYTRLQAYNTVDLPSLLEGSLRSGRERVLPVLGPADPNGESTSAFIDRLIGPEGAYPYLSRFLGVDSPGGFRISVRDVMAIGTRRWAEFGTDNLKLAAIPVHHGGLPALAWRVEIDDYSVVFAGGFSNQKGTVAKFAEEADALVVHHAISESARGRIRDLYSRPSELGRIATDAKVRMLVLGHRTTRTLGMETINTGAIREQYTGPLIFGDELECWGL
ncbi:MAG: MBL fold metallo-hydrolase [Gammaproteobacteria bacterium]|nr:MBL fold metallo-hydrolase [Gammaproteobacteria bacterium]MYK47174.1 MBL fold metallo-hydrolase [Gammaproteobacteria bacterium]